MDFNITKSANDAMLEGIPWDELDSDCKQSARDCKYNKSSWGRALAARAEGAQAEEVADEVTNDEALQAAEGFSNMLSALMPKRIVLVRHGRSEGNADDTLYRTVSHMRLHRPISMCAVQVADNKINLTSEYDENFIKAKGIEACAQGPRCGDNGVEQAKFAGRRFKQLVGDDPVFVYHSPFNRTVQTNANMKLAFNSQVQRCWPDSRLREQVQPLDSTD